MFSLWSSLRDLFPFVRWIVLRLFIISILGFIYFWASVLLYFVFYWYYIPPVYHVQPTHFQFTSECSHSLRPVCSFPRAEVSLRNVLLSGEMYSASVSLDLPDSHLNRNIGMFMVNLTLYSESQEILLATGRHFLLKYQSTLIRLMSKIVYAFPLILGFTEEKQTLSAKILESYIDDAHNPAAFAAITITSRNLEVYRGTVRFEAHFSGLRYLMYYWPITTAVYMIGNMVFLMLLGTILLWFAMVTLWLANDNQQQRRQQRAPNQRPLQAERPTQQQMQRSSSSARLTTLHASQGDDGDVHSDESGSGSRAVLRRRRGFRINDDDVDDDEIN
ncbi:seipin-like [Oscarella lobularis]|uniref:seipin-like n=1 Tax=Oscarella lobularis TaxID=121494 RepID=UPI0033137E71